MKKSNLMYEAACSISNKECIYVCHAISWVDGKATLEQTENIREDVMQDVRTFAKASGATPLAVTFYEAHVHNELPTTEEIRTLRTMYCLFMQEYYKDQGE